MRLNTNKQEYEISTTEYIHYLPTLAIAGAATMALVATGSL